MGCSAIYFIKRIYSSKIYNIWSVFSSYSSAFCKIQTFKCCCCCLRSQQNWSSCDKKETFFSHEMSCSNAYYAANQSVNIFVDNTFLPALSIFWHISIFLDFMFSIKNIYVYLSMGFNGFWANFQRIYEKKRFKTHR